MRQLRDCGDMTFHISLVFPKNSFNSIKTLIEGPLRQLKRSEKISGELRQRPPLRLCFCGTGRQAYLTNSVDFGHIVACIAEDYPMHAGALPCGAILSGTAMSQV